MGPNNCSPNPNKDSTLITWSHKLRSAQKTKSSHPLQNPPLYSQN